MRKLKIIVSLLLILSFIPIVPGMISSAKNKYDFVIPNIEKYTSALSLSASEVYELTDELRTAARNYETGVSLGKYKMPFDLTSSTCVYDLLFDGSDIIQVSSLQNHYYQDTGEYAQVDFNYIYSEQEYKANIQKCRQEAKKYIAGIDNSLSDVEKALIIHDRLAANCEYDQDGVNSGNVSDESYTMYGIFVNKKAVCQGYTHAYSYLLNLLGIDSYSCRSTAMNHVWNIVVIDGKRYHIDVTWDDPVSDIIGRVMHNNFMKSSDVFLTSHVATDYDVSPSDTRYDNVFWANSKAQFCIVDGKIFYIDTVNAQLKQYSGDVFDNSKDEVIYTFTEKWRASATSAWSGNFSMLAADDNVIIFTTNNAAYYYIPITDKLSKLTDVDLSGYTYYNIFGMQASDNVLTFYINDNPNKNSSTGEFITLPYHIDIPTTVISGSLEFFCPSPLVKVHFYIYKSSFNDDEIIADAEDGGKASSQVIYVDPVFDGNICKINFSQKMNKGNYKICVVSDADDSIPLVMNCSAMEDATPLGTVHVYQHGDISGDYIVNITDALMTLRVALKMDKKHAGLIKVMDCNNDNEITTADSAIILQYAVGAREKL